MRKCDGCDCNGCEAKARMDRWVLALAVIGTVWSTGLLGMFVGWW